MTTEKKLYGGNLIFWGKKIIFNGFYLEDKLAVTLNQLTGLQ